MHGLGNDCRLALRGFARRPGLLAGALLSLAFGICANAAVLSIADAFLWRPFGIQRPGEIIALRFEPKGETREVSWPD